MKLISLTIVLLTGFALNLMAVPAAPYLITFAQPDGSTFLAHLKGDENFSWIETQNKQVLVKSKSSGFFEFALIEEEMLHVHNWGKCGKVKWTRKEILNSFLQINFP